MTRVRLWFAAAVLLVVAGEAVAQRVDAKSSALAPFIGTWVFTMSNPQGSEQTVRIVDKNGVAGASLQIDAFPPSDITGILRDGDMLVLTTTLRENGAPIWAVIALTLEGETMNMAQMLQMSQTIKRGTGRRQAERAADPSRKPDLVGLGVLRPTFTTGS